MYESDLSLRNLGNDKTKSIEDELTIVSTVDGFIHAIDKNNEKKWSTSTGKTLISSYHHSNDENNNNPNSNYISSNEYSIIPNIDGSLLVHNSIGMRKTSVKARMLIEKTPFISPDNELIFTGQTTNKLINININTGKIMREIDVNSFNPHSIRSDFEKNDPSVWLGRVDYTIRAFNEKLGFESFNLSYGEIRPLSNGILTAPKDALMLNNQQRINIRQNLLLHKEKRLMSTSQRSKLYSLSSGELLFVDNNKVVNSLNLDAPAANAFTLNYNQMIGNVENSYDNSNQQFDFEPLKISYRIPSNTFSHLNPYNELVEDDFDENSDSLNIIEVKRLHNGGLYAMESSFNYPIDELGQQFSDSERFDDLHSYLPSLSLSCKGIGSNCQTPLAVPSTNIKSNLQLIKSVNKNIHKGKTFDKDKSTDLISKYIKSNHENLNNNEVIEKHCIVYPNTFNNKIDESSENVLLSNQPVCLVGHHVLIPNLQSNHLPFYHWNELVEGFDVNLTRDSTLIFKKNNLLLIPKLNNYLFLIFGLVMIIFLYEKIKRKFHMTYSKDKYIDNNLNLRIINNSSIQSISDDIVNTSNNSASKVVEFINEKGEKVIRIGSLEISDRVLGYGSQGTIVYEGNLNGRPVAVKRMLSQFSKIADREMSLLIRSDGHPNVVRYFLKEEYGDFIYLALQLCSMSLKDFVTYCGKQNSFNSKVDISDEVRLGLLQIAKGVTHLHSQRIVHRDLKPHNILCALPEEMQIQKTADINNLSINNINDYTLKISDMGLSKQLDSINDTSLSIFMMSRENKSRENESYVGTIGWQAPELLIHRKVASLRSGRSIDKKTSDLAIDGNDLRLPNNNFSDSIDSVDVNDSDVFTSTKSISNGQSQKVDIFSLGCIFYYVLNHAQHPYGDWHERETNIINNNPVNLINDLIDFRNDLNCNYYDFYDLLLRMIANDPEKRPTGNQLCYHPFFWTSQSRLDFLVELSDRLEHEPVESKLVLAIESNAVDVIGNGWDRRLPLKLLEDIDKYRKYDKSSVRDLLRLIRNKRHHFHELDNDLKQLMSPMPSGFISYFETKFPKLLLHCITIVCKYLPCDRIFQIYCEHISELLLDIQVITNNSTITSSISNNINNSTDDVTTPNSEESIVIWFGSVISEQFSCQGWYRDRACWVSGIKFNTGSGKSNKSRPMHLVKASTDFRYRTRLCSHWESTHGTICPMRKKGKCDFSHGPLELRVKDTRRDKWGKPPQPDTNSLSTSMILRLSGGEDVLGSARQLNSASNSSNQQPYSLKINNNATTQYNSWGIY